jgi:tRNA(adenine34) deaminase
MNSQHSYYMNEALALAKGAFEAGEVPIGAVVVDPDGTIIGRGANAVERGKSQTAHAELLAIQEASRNLGDWRLEGCWIYVTLEPCLRCLGAIGLSRLAGLTYAVGSPEFGAFRLIDKSQADLYLGRLSVLQGLKQEESADMLKMFFKRARGGNSNE